MQPLDKRPVDSTARYPVVSRRAFLRQLGATLGAAVLAACGGAAPPAEAPADTPSAATVAPAAVSGTLKLALMYNENEFSDAEIKAFTDANPNIQVERVPWADDAQFKAMLAAGNLPDVFRTE